MMHSGHDHGHSDAPQDFGLAFIVGTSLNVAFVVLETVFGFISNSTALLADAGHNLSDVLGLLVAWAAYGLSRRPPDDRFTYGLRSSSILAALFNAMFLLVAVGAITWEAVQRLVHPQPVASITIMTVASIGIAINGFTAWLFASGRKGDLNIRGAFLHMLADAAVSAGVVASGIVIFFTDWLWIDPLASMSIALVILWGTWGLLRESVLMSLSAVPPRIEISQVRAYLERLPGVLQIHDLHIWPIGTTKTALTCHLVMPAGHQGDRFLMHVAHTLEEQFGIDHATLQVETSTDTACALAPEHVV
jgi:cobalt-zinc-cadmium efflux system protein